MSLSPSLASRWRVTKQPLTQKRKEREKEVAIAIRAIKFDCPSGSALAFSVAF